MELHIELEQDLELYNFLKWLPNKMADYLIENIDSRKLIYFDEYINSDNIIKWRSERLKHILTSKDILIAGTYNLTIDHNNNSYTIRLNPNAFIPDTYAKFINIINLINYGTLTLFAYPIYDKMMEFFAENIQSFYQVYLEESN